MVPESLLNLVQFALLAHQSFADSLSNVFNWGGSRYSCKCYEGEACWPTTPKWSQLNTTVNGNLFNVIPEASVCHYTFEGKPTYNEAGCKELREKWGDAMWHPGNPISIEWTTWTNTTCNPTEDPNEPCTLGFFPGYVIMAKTKEHVKAGIDFARKNNLRLVIRNTGHDFMGRSTGYGALAINTHALKGITFTDSYTGPGDYHGPAVTIGTGVQAFEILDAAHAQDPPRMIVGGECPSVATGGGFVQGGGHGPLSGQYGMGADQALDFELVTADGRFVKANAGVNPDLFWAMQGGGPSTYAAIISLTIKTFPDQQAAGVSLHINETHTTDLSLFWKGYTIFHNYINYYVDNGLYVNYDLTQGMFSVKPFLGPGMNKTQILNVLNPLFKRLQREGVPFSFEAKEFSTFYDLYRDMFPDRPAGLSMITAGRLITRKDFLEREPAIIDAKKTAAKRGYVVAHVVAPGKGKPVANNAIHPAWRETSEYSFSVYTVPENSTWDQKIAAEKFNTDKINGPLRLATPNGGAYVGEGDLAEPNWQTAFWGSKYPKLREIKKKWDPNGVFYSRTTPGTEDWEVIDYGRRLCKKL